MKTKLKTTNIHGKEYVEVHTRIQYFRKNFKNWALVSDIEKLELITINGKELGSSSIPNEYKIEPKGKATQSLELTWNKSCEVIKKLKEKFFN